MKKCFEGHDGDDPEPLVWTGTGSGELIVSDKDKEVTSCFVVVVFVGADFPSARVSLLSQCLRVSPPAVLPSPPVIVHTGLPFFAVSFFIERRA